jgi:hypothetical protein
MTMLFSLLVNTNVCSEGSVQHNEEKVRREKEEKNPICMF